MLQHDNHPSVFRQGVGSVRHRHSYVTRGRKNIRRIRTLGAEGTERSRAHNAHNHPSGVAEPSHADETLTQALKEALALIDVRVLDHFVVGRGATLSFAERGLL